MEGVFKLKGLTLLCNNPLGTQGLWDRNPIFSFTNSTSGQFPVTIKVSNRTTLISTYTFQYAFLVSVAPTAVPPGATDVYEPNNTPYQAFERSDRRSFINVGAQLANLNFFTTTPGTREQGDVDWYRFYAPTGRSHPRNHGRATRCRYRNISVRNAQSACPGRNIANGQSVHPRGNSPITTTTNRSTVALRLFSTHVL